MCMSTQIAVRLTDDELEKLDWIVVHCELGSRADGVRIALDALQDRLRRDEIGRQIVEGYRRMPETEEEIAEAHRLSLESIDEEPWERWW